MSSGASGAAAAGSHVASARSSTIMSALAFREGEASAARTADTNGAACTTAVVCVRVC